MLKTVLCHLLGIEYPILQGGLALEGNGELAAAVSEAGALGMIGINPGWAPEGARLDNFRNHVQKAKSLTQKPFGVNIPLERGPSQTKEEVLAARRTAIDIAIEEGVRVIVVAGGDPRLLTGYIKSAGATVLHVVMNVSMAKKAEAAGVDAVIASGFEAGGFLGADELPTFILVPLVVDTISIPVVAAGGIGDARGFVAAMALGAAAIQLGTRFMATTECHAHPDFKKALLAATDCGTIVTRRNMPPSYRSLKTNLTEFLQQLDHRGAPPEEIRQHARYRNMHAATILGSLDEGEPGAGIIAAGIKEIESAGEVVRSLVNGVTEVISRLNQWHQ